MMSFVTKELNHKVLWLEINVYSESRTFDNKLFKHFLDIKMFGILIFHCFWRTGLDEQDKPNLTAFYVDTIFSKFRIFKKDYIGDIKEYND
jgi:hypothetical protein